MRLYILRHGEADWPDWEGPDDERPLTKKGKKEMKRVAEALEELEVDPDVVLTSPLPRAAQTAEIAAKALDLEATEEPLLAPGFDVGKLMELLGRYTGKDVMIVGHNPDFENTLSALTGAHVRLSKAGFARVDIDDPSQPQGQLVWLVPPKFMTDL